MLDICVVENPTDNDLSLECNCNWVNQGGILLLQKFFTILETHVSGNNCHFNHNYIHLYCSSCIHVMILGKAASIWLFAMSSSVVVC